LFVVVETRSANYTVRMKGDMIECFGQRRTDSVNLQSIESRLVETEATRDSRDVANGGKRAGESEAGGGA